MNAANSKKINIIKLISNKEVWKFATYATVQHILPLCKQMDESWEIQQEERRQFVETLGIDYRYGCYEAKRPESCHLLGEYMEAIDQNLKGAFQIFKVNCEKEKYPHSCRKYAAYMLLKREPFDDRAINDALECACNANIPIACRYLGLLQNKNAKSEACLKNACEKLEKACKLEDGRACWILSQWFLGFSGIQQETIKSENETSKSNEVQKIAVAKNVPKALKYAIAACDLNVYQSCFNASRIYRLGNGIQKDEAKAKEYKAKGLQIAELRAKSDVRLRNELKKLRSEL